MEKWRKVFVGAIPQGIYQTQIINGEDKGLIIELKSKNAHVVLDFGIVQAVRVLDEGIVQKELYSEDEIAEFRKDGFKNVIYEVTDGQFGNEVIEISSGFLEASSVKHYVIITENFNIDIITEWEPDINII